MLREILKLLQDSVALSFKEQQKWKLKIKDLNSEKYSKLKFILQSSKKREQEILLNHKVRFSKARNNYCEKLRHIAEILPRLRKEAERTFHREEEARAEKMLEDI